jgi:hypothetical protein
MSFVAYTKNRILASHEKNHKDINEASARKGTKLFQILADASGYDVDNKKTGPLPVRETGRLSIHRFSD